MRKLESTEQRAIARGFSLTDTEHKNLRFIADHKGVSMSELIRRWVKRDLRIIKSKEN